MKVRKTLLPSNLGTWSCASSSPVPPLSRNRQEGMLGREEGWGGHGGGVRGCGSSRGGLGESEGEGGRDLAGFVWVACKLCGRAITCSCAATHTRGRGGQGWNSGGDGGGEEAEGDRKGEDRGYYLLYLDPLGGYRSAILDLLETFFQVTFFQVIIICLSRCYPGPSEEVLLLLLLLLLVLLGMIRYY
jgi:hypothetical protein